MMTDRVISSRTVYKGWFDVLMLKLKLASGEEIEREVVEHPSGAAVLPFDVERRVAMLITEARPPVLHVGEERMLEAIAGMVEDGDPADTARREALEEGGLSLDRLDHVACVWPTPATSTERVDFYLAEYRGQDRIAPGGGLPEEEEHVRVKEVPLAELWTMAETGRLRDAKTLTLVQALRIRRPELF
jgi:nudix-type nucleoside diphosphatase (YffH/AdpP family)